MLSYRGLLASTVWRRASPKTQWVAEPRTKPLDAVAAPSIFHLSYLNGLPLGVGIGRGLSTSSSSGEKFRLTMKTIRPCVKKTEYAVRGKTLLEAAKLEAEGRKVLYCNIGDCHAMEQKPLTFVRQLLMACTHPDPNKMCREGVFPPDVVERAKLILEDCGGRSIGSYSDSEGIKVIRQHVAEFIEERDKVPFKDSQESVYLINGASDGVKTMLFFAMGEESVNNKKTAILIPLPTYPLYSATVDMFDTEKITYALDEDHDWKIDIDKVRQQLHEARNKFEPRIMVVVNPGNPTGQYLPVENVKDIIKLCHEEGLLLFADEVYQENIHDAEGKFHSFRKVLHGMDPIYKDLQMISFNSTSKGLFGECGIRGGYMHMQGFDEDIMYQLRKLISVSLCPNTPGQIVTDALVKCPKHGDPSHDLYQQEREVIRKELEEKASLVYTGMNRLNKFGVKCNKVQGALYAYPQIEIPEKAREDAEKEDPNMNLDMYYCLEFLRQQAVCVVPGSGFGRLEGKWHFRTTILPPIEKIEDMLNRFEKFHTNFLKKYK